MNEENKRAWEEHTKAWAERRAKERLERVRVRGTAISVCTLAALNSLVPSDREPNNSDLISAMAYAVAEVLEQMEERRMPGIL